MTTVLHALWLPAGISGPEGELALWGEEARRSSERAAYAHPWAITAKRVDQLLWRIWGRRSSGAVPFETRALTLALPTAERRPVGFAADASSDPYPREATLQPWRVEAYAVGALQAFTILLGLESVSDEIRYGPSLLFWRQLAQLAAVALWRGQYVPTADEAGRGRWQIVLTDPVFQGLAAQCLAAMPSSARALARPLPPPDVLQRDFLDALTHAFISQAYTPSQKPFADAVIRRGPQATLTALQPADRWWLDLFPRTRYSLFHPKLDPPAQQSFGERVRAWALPTSEYIASAYRLVLRLEPPNATEATDPNAPDWRLSFNLQPKSEPETLWSASAIWSDPPLPELPAVLRAGLVQAALFYPPLAQALEESAPEALALTVAQSLEFLEDVSALLVERGIEVLVPTWWRQRRQSLRAKLMLGKGGESSGLLGLEALVEFDWEMALGDQQITLDEFMRLAQSKTALVQVHGTWLQVDPQQMQAALKLIQRHQKTKGKLALREALSLALAQPGEWEGLTLETVQTTGWLDQIARKLTGRRALEPVPQAAGFIGQLRPYQLNGLSWLVFMRELGLGACLADDMGLGKGIQVLALLAHDLLTGRLTGPILMVCPTTVVANWVQEAAHFVPQLRCYAHHGPQRAKGEAFVEMAKEYHLIITSYVLLARDQTFFSEVSWCGVILDEAHNIKNPDTKQAHAARRLSAGFRIALTGTPIENRLQDLWSLMHFLNPGYLGTAEGFTRRFAAPIERYQDADAAAQLRQLTGPFLLRRVKTDPAVIQDLPPKNEMKEYCGLTKEQAALYRAVVQESLRQIEESQGIQRRGVILATLTKLKQACNHPRHLLGDHSALAERSGKLNRLTEMVEQALAEEDHILIFTQYAEMGKLLQEHLNKVFPSETTLFLYGGVPAPQRAEMIERFQAGQARLFVLSLKAGGAGINLTRANRVFHYDRWWNPAVEEQATDRAFRIGQTRTVQVHKLICRGTLEERVDELITRKIALAGQVVSSGEAWLTELSTDELRDLMLLRKDAVDD